MTAEKHALQTLKEGRGMNFLKIGSFMVMGVILSGCQSHPQADLVSKSYLTSPSFCLKVDRIEVATPVRRTEGEKISLYGPLETLESDLRTWAMTRFHSCGGAPKARISFPRVDVRQTIEPPKELFQQGRDLFSIGVTSQVEILDEHGFPVSLVHLSIDRETSLSESLNLEEREQKLEQFKTKLLNDLDQQMTDQVRKNLSRHVK